MPKLKANISVSLDGFVAGPNQTLEEPLGVAPMVFGDGVRLFDGGQVFDPPYALERIRVIESPTGVTHIKYRVGAGDAV